MRCQSFKRASESVEAPWCLGWEMTYNLPHNLPHSVGQNKIQAQRNGLHFFSGRNYKVMLQRHKLRKGQNWSHFCNQSTTNSNLESAGKPSVSLAYFIPALVSGVLQASWWMDIPISVEKNPDVRPLRLSLSSSIGSLVFPLSKSGRQPN